MLLSNSLWKSYTKIHMASNCAETCLITHILAVSGITMFLILSSYIKNIFIVWIFINLLFNRGILSFILCVSSGMICYSCLCPFCLWNFAFIVLTSNIFLYIKNRNYLSCMLIVPEVVLVKNLQKITIIITQIWKVKPCAIALNKLLQKKNALFQDIKNIIKIV